MSKPTDFSPEFVSQIYLVRGHRIMPDFDLATIYGVSTARLNQQVSRNSKRFPEEFMFPLSVEEFEHLILQNATSSWGGRRKIPNAFTEHGALMAASVLNSDMAVQASIFVIKAFVALRNAIGRDRELEARLAELERTTKAQFQAQDSRIDSLFDGLRQLVQTENAPRRRIGFQQSPPDE